ncbi:MAG: hypothetical protein M3R51_00355 [Candidatus Eremiobacteraeota bacterium]|nr:hypothetical protein [Candidatus Eremiobacteraeota bacterium]
MFDVSDSLRCGLAAAQERLAQAQSSLADANTGPGGRSLDAAMSATARAAIFNEALLGAVHARLAELKTVSRA